MRRFLAVLASAALLVGCQGEKGPAGPTGPGGTSAGAINGVVRDGLSNAVVAGATIVTEPVTSTATSAADGGYAIATVPVGVYTVRITAAGFVEKVIQNVSVVAGGAATADAQLFAPAATTGGVAGVVQRRAADADPNAPVAGATVVLIDADDVAASTADGPLEALAGASTLSDVTDAAGAYAIANVPPGRYFVHVAPDAADLSVFPGGDASRVSFTVAAGQSVSKNVVLSQRAPAAATFVGSSTCLVCHTNAMGGAGPKGNYKRSLHALVYRKPGEPTANQDMSQLPNKDKGLALFVSGNANDNMIGVDDLASEYGLRISKTDEPARFSAWPAYNVLLGKDATGYFFQTENAAKTLKSQKYYVAFTFGGHGLYKQRFLTRVKADKSYQACTGAPGTPCTDWSYFVSPVQFDEAMQPGVQQLHPYNGANWGAPAAADGVALVAGPNASFDLNCAGCHFTGNKLARVGTLFQADAVNDANGAIDYDMDGVKDEISVGCESCHGPGSEHASAPARGKNILVPSLLSAERMNQVCTNCHTRGRGKGGFIVGGVLVDTENPSKGDDAAITFAYPGMSRAEFVADYHTDNLGVYNDVEKHARQHHQQGNDMLKSKHFRNPFDLVTCDSCHDMHDRANGPSLVARVDDNSLCLGCHAPFGFGLQPGWTKEAEALAVSSHVAENAFMMSGYDPANAANLGAVAMTGQPFVDPVSGAFSTAIGGVGRCTTCHMSKTAASQSRFQHERFGTATIGGVATPVPQPAGPRIRGDVSSHQFDVVWPAQSEAVLRNFASNNLLSNSCGSCHNSLSGVAPNYAY